MPIIGKAVDRSDDIIERCAELVGCEPAMIDAILLVETNADAFDPSNRLVIRPEFHKIPTCPYLDAAKKKVALKIPQPKLVAYERDPVGAGSVAWQYVDKLAAECGEEAAFWITSFGSPQIMGFNFQMCKYDSPSAMVRAFAESEDEQILAMGRWLVASGLKEALRLRKYATIARVYNGTGYARNAYDAKLEFAYEHSSRAKSASSYVDDPDDGALQLGSHGGHVLLLQQRLRDLGFHTDADGDFGIETRDAVRAAQYRFGIAVDGKAGPETQKTLATAPAKEPNQKPLLAIFKDSGTAQSALGTLATGGTTAVVAGANAIVAPQPAPTLPGIADIDAVIKTSETGMGLMTKILSLGVDKLLIALALGAMIWGGIVLFKRVQAQRLRKVG